MEAILCLSFNKISSEMIIDVNFCSTSIAFIEKRDEKKVKHDVRFARSIIKVGSPTKSRNPIF